MATDEERKAFFLANLDEADNAICGANARRAANKKPPMTQAQVDEGLDEMMILKAEGKPIDTYDFNESSWKPKEIKEGATTVAVSSPVNAKGEKFSFDVIKCANGFLMNMTQDNASKTFIFKTQAELGDIFNQVLFSSEVGLNESELRV